MNDGERQVAPTRAGIRRDHVARYEWAAKRLPGARVLDVACGVGYGTQLLAEAGECALGMDRDAEAIDYAREFYNHPRAEYLQADLEDEASAIASAGEFDCAVCFETIEHLADPVPLLRGLRKACKSLIASVPNELVFPHGGRIKYHYRHYVPAEFEELLAFCGWRVAEWHGQVGPQSEVEPEKMGRTMIAVCERAELPAEQPGDAAPAALAPAVARPKATVAALEDNPPEHVAIVAMGTSCARFFELTRREGGARNWCDEVWGINVMGDVLRCDRVFHMDDLRIQEMRAAARPESNIARWLPWLRKHPGPIYTSVVRSGYPGLVAYPLEKVLNALSFGGVGGVPYFNSTPSYAIALAVAIGVKKISLWGLDYTMANRHQAEKGRACCEFWLGVAMACGIEIQVPAETSLMDAAEKPEHRLYGYDCVDVHFHDRPGGTTEVRFTERAQICTAAEIEERYDHTKHPNPLMRGEKKE